MRAHTAHATFATKPMLRRVARSIQTRITATGCRKQTRSSRIFFTLPNLPGFRGGPDKPAMPSGGKSFASRLAGYENAWRSSRLIRGRRESVMRGAHVSIEKRLWAYSEDVACASRNTEPGDPR